jgi:hypothetical protein
MAVVGLTQVRAGDVRTWAPVLIIRRHGRFGRPIRLAGGSQHYTGFDAAINRRGDVLVAWQRRGTIYGRIGTANGQLRRPARLDHTGTAQLSVWLADDRSATVAWEAHEPGGTEVHATRALPGGHLLRRPTLLEHFDGRRYSSTRNSCVQAVTTSPSGRATVLWSQSGTQAGAVDLLAASQTTPRGTYGSPETVTGGARKGAALTIDPITTRLVAACVTTQDEVRVATAEAPGG